MLLHSPKLLDWPASKNRPKPCIMHHAYVCERVGSREREGGRQCSRSRIRGDKGRIRAKGEGAARAAPIGSLLSKDPHIREWWLGEESGIQIGVGFGWRVILKALASVTHSLMKEGARGICGHSSKLGHLHFNAKWQGLTRSLLGGWGVLVWWGQHLVLMHILASSE